MAGWRWWNARSDTATLAMVEIIGGRPMHSAEVLHTLLGSAAIRLDARLR